MSFQPGDEVRLKHSGREGVVRRVNKDSPPTAVLVDVQGDRTIVVAQENLELAGARDPVREAVNRRLAAYYAGERRVP